MIARIRITGLGPHDDCALDLGPGTTEITGPSEVGKSALIEAVCFALWGRTSQGARFPVEWIRDGHEAATVELQLGERTLLRRMTRSKHVTRTFGGDAYPSDGRLAEALGAVGPAVKLGCVLVAPLGWPALVAANARPFRDLLTDVLPAADTAAVVRERVAAAGHALRGDWEAAIGEREVGRMRREARAERDRTTGQIETLSARVAELERALAEVPEADRRALKPSTRILALQRAWEAYDRVRERNRLEEGVRAQARQAEAGWTQRAEALGPEPVADAAALEAATRAEATARAALDETTTAYRADKAHLDEARGRLDALLATGDPSQCPTCGHRPWEGGVQAAAQCRQHVADAQRQVDVRVADGKDRRAAHEAAQTRVAEAREARARHEAWRRARAALGPRPQVPAAPVEPTPPDQPRPAAVDLGVLDGAVVQQQQDLASARQQLEAARAAHERLHAEADRLDVLLGAVREAPSVVARTQAEVLGDLGPVSLHFGENPAVEVRIDGRPWWLASRGRQVVADAWLRAALRRASGLELPLFVDNAQDVGGMPLPPLDGQVVVLRTTAQGEGLTVR